MLVEGGLTKSLNKCLTAGLTNDVLRHWVEGCLTRKGFAWDLSVHRTSQQLVA